MEDFFGLVPPALYHTVFLWSTTGMAVATIIRYSNSGKSLILSNKYRFPLISLLLCCIFAVFIGTRNPYNGHFFTDTVMYTHSYNNIISSMMDYSIETEWLWNNIAYICNAIGLNVTEYYIVIASMYFSFTFLACHHLMRNNVWIALLFCMTSFSFYSYGVNGIRNGFACSMFTYAIALITGKNKISITIGLVLAVLCTGIHQSIMLPLVCTISALLFIRQPLWAIRFWGISILISLVAGNAVGNIFAGLGFDDRTHYFNDASLGESANAFSSTGFRFDFLLYSAMPILMMWYATIRRNFQDRAYNLIAITYTLANAFWVMVIRAEFSNRFAYLSWFLYPIVIAYPLLRFNMWEDQDRKTAIILALYAGFTLFMSVVYYG